ncbi:Uncharacterised protein [uncultured archaeon]|nr:Uncharacterised protein [uncultured archaeon]
MPTLTPEQARLVRQTFYTPLKGNGDHDMMHVVHDVARGIIYRVYTDNYFTKNLGQQELLEKLPKAGEFTTTSSEFQSVLADAAKQGILNQPLPA